MFLYLFNLLLFFGETTLVIEITLLIHSETSLVTLVHIILSCEPYNKTQFIGFSGSPEN